MLNVTACTPAKHPRPCRKILPGIECEARQGLHGSFDDQKSNVTCMMYCVGSMIR
jgi:hypothetical protein